MRYVDRGPNGCPGLEGDGGRYWNSCDELKFYGYVAYYTAKIVFEGLYTMWRNR